MLLRILALHHSMHHSPGSYLIPELDPQINQIPTGNNDQEKDQDFSRADNELDHALFPLFKPDEWNTATP